MHNIFTFEIFPRGFQRRDFWTRAFWTLFEPAVTVSVDQQMAKHEHDRMAVGNRDVEKSHVRYKGCEREAGIKWVWFVKYTKKYRCHCYRQDLITSSSSLFIQIPKVTIAKRTQTSNRKVVDSTSCSVLSHQTSQSPWFFLHQKHVKRSTFQNCYNRIAV